MKLILDTLDNTVYSANGWIGSLLEPHGIKIAYTPAGIVVAMTVMGLPFVVRTLQPVIEDIEKDRRGGKLPGGESSANILARLVAGYPAINPYGLCPFLCPGGGRVRFGYLLCLSSHLN